MINWFCSGGDHIQEIKENVQKIVDQYEHQLSLRGIRLLVTKMYFENHVHEKYNRSGIAETIERNWLRKQERKKGYHFQNNRYHCIVLTVLPVETNLLKKERCKQYAYVLRKVERAYVGEKPEKTAYEDNKVLNKIEKRIARILRDAQNRSPQEMCAETWRDAVRYLCAVKYSYKKKILGKERGALEIFLLVVFSLLAVIGALLL